MPKMNIKKGDKVQVLSGKDKGAQGEVLRAMPAEGKVVVEGVAMVKRHTKPTQANQQGGIVEREAAIDVSNVMLICPACGKATRVGHAVNADGKKYRVCKKCGEQVSAEAVGRLQAPRDIPGRLSFCWPRGAWWNVRLSERRLRGALTPSFVGYLSTPS